MTHQSPADTRRALISPWHIPCRFSNYFPIWENFYEDGPKNRTQTLLFFKDFQHLCRGNNKISDRIMFLISCHKIGIVFTLFHCNLIEHKVIHINQYLTGWFGHHLNAKLPYSF